MMDDEWTDQTTHGDGRCLVRGIRCGSVDMIEALFAVPLHKFWLSKPQRFLPSECVVYLWFTSGSLGGTRSNPPINTATQSSVDTWGVESVPKHQRSTLRCRFFAWGQQVLQKKRGEPGPISGPPHWPLGVRELMFRLFGAWTCSGEGSCVQTRAETVWGPSGLRFVQHAREVVQVHPLPNTLDKSGDKSVITGGDTYYGLPWLCCHGSTQW